jgi:uncharacterized zinc-type alcohol dehydrogenase-like protein
MIAAKAYAATSTSARLTPYSFTRRAPRANDVVIDILYCGICHSDIHHTRGEWGDIGIYPLVPGHEIVGKISAIGSGATKFKIGDVVGVGVIVDSCRTCPQCTKGLEQYCADDPTYTYSVMERDGSGPTQGGYSSVIVVDEDYVLRMPLNLPLDAAAPLLCAGITLYSPLRHWGAGPGKRIAIAGLGGLGHMGVKLARAMGADVTVLSHSAGKRDDALQMGAHHFHTLNDAGAFAALRGTFDLLINTVSAEIDWNAYLSLLAVDGHMVMVGLPQQPVPVSAFALVGGRKSLAGSGIGGIAETQEMLDFCGQHNIVCDIERIGIQQVNEAWDRVVKNDVRFRFVIDMQTLTAAA